jgi:hypothetical protein
VTARPLRRDTAHSQFPLSIAAHHSIPLTASGAALRLRLQNSGGIPVDGDVSVVADNGQTGVSERFSCPAGSGFTPGTAEVVVFTPFNGQSISAAASIRIYTRNDISRRFYQGRILLSQPTPGHIQVTVDRSIHAQTVLGGLVEEGPIHIYSGPTHAEWQTLSLDYRGPLQLASPDDRRPLPTGLLRCRPIDKEPDQPLPDAPLRMTLNLVSNGTQPQRRVHLLAGDILRIGRMDAFPQGQHTNDVILHTVPPNLYHRKFISRRQGIFQRTRGEFSYTDLSETQGSRLGNHVLQQNVPQVLRSRGVLQPGYEGRKWHGSALELHYRQYPAAPTDWLEKIHLLCTDEGWSETTSGLANQTLLLQRSDSVPESYIFMLHTLCTGTDSNLCPWQLHGTGSQPLHAIIAAFDDSFWITPCSSQACIKVNHQLLPNERLTRLRPGQTLTLGHEIWTVSEWSQHILNCNCCSPHQS